MGDGRPDGGGHDTFASDWLALRETADHRARSTEFAARLARLGADLGWSRVLDLGSGRGSNLRFLGPRLEWAGEWTAVDHDAALLRELERTCDREVRTIRADLRHEGLDAVATADLVTASALLDLVTAEWLDALVDRCGAAGCAVLVALTWDGTAVWDPPDPMDAAVLEAVRRHQTGRKGMGTALGPSATVAAVSSLRGVGYEVDIEATPWRLSGERDAALAEEFARGWVEAAAETRPGARPQLEAWLTRRVESVRSGRFALRVGHHDLLALPPDGVPDPMRDRNPPGTDPSSRERPS